MNLYKAIISCCIESPRVVGQAQDVTSVPVRLATTPGYLYIRVSYRAWHRVGRLLSFFSSRRNWDSPTPSPAGECAPPHGTE